MLNMASLLVEGLSLILLSTSFTHSHILLPGMQSAMTVPNWNRCAQTMFDIMVRCCIIEEAGARAGFCASPGCAGACILVPRGRLESRTCVSNLLLIRSCWMKTGMLASLTHLPKTSALRSQRRAPRPRHAHAV